MDRLHSGAPLGASYTLVELVGKGSSGQVWKLKHAKKTEPLVAKILYSHLADDPSIVERFVRERSVLMGLEHKHIVSVYDLVVEGGTLGLVMDYYQGGSLRDVLVSRKTLQPAVALRIVATVLDALVYAHGQGVVHRDIKPDNILFDVVGESDDMADGVKVTDFGISSILNAEGANTTGIVGTPYYIPPELIQNGVSGASGDTYSAGIMLYELLAGRTPFAGEGTDFTIAYRHVSAEVPALDLPEPLWKALLSLVDKNPQQRPHPLDAADRLRRLSETYADLPALPPLAEPESFSVAERPKTVMRGIREESDSDEVAPLQESPAPVLGESAAATILKPQHVNRVSEAPDVFNELQPVADSKKQRRKGILLSVLGLVLLIGAGWGIYWAVTSNNTHQEKFSAEGRQESVLPTGLSVRREATYDPASSTISLSTTYSAQKTPLSGDFLEVIPAIGDGVCPNVTAQDSQVQRNQPMVTGMDVKCGWDFQGLEIGSNDEVTVKSTVSLAVQDQKQLEDWIESVSKQTQEAISSKDYKSSSYPAQRIQDISVKVPAHTVSQSVLPVRLLPVWPSGEDALNPLYSSENIGDPSGMLQNIAGDKNPIRFSDGCGGHLMVDSSGLRVTALSAVDRCSLNAQVGNFTDLKSENFSITTRK